MTYSTPEEKKTDVNIAVNLLSDAISGAFDTAIIVSGDSDLEPAVEWVVKNQPTLKVNVYIPSLPCDEQKRSNFAYKRMGVNCRFLPLDKLGHFQLPSIVTLPNGAKVERPSSWTRGYRSS